MIKISIFGGSRVDSLTVFTVIVLVSYTILVNGVMFTYGEQATDANPFENIAIDMGDYESFMSNEVENVTPSVIFPNPIYFDDNLTPSRWIIWTDDLFGENFFEVVCDGVNFWETHYLLEPSGLGSNRYQYGTKTTVVYESELIENYSFERNFTKVNYDVGGTFQTSVYYCPLFFYNETDGTKTYIDVDLETSLGNGEITVVMATNSTFYSYDIGQIFGIMTGFSGFEGYDIPSEISVLIGGIWWTLLILTVVKLVVG